MEDLKKKGLIFIHLKHPIHKGLDEIQVVNWILDSPNPDLLSELDLSKLSNFYNI